MSRGAIVSSAALACALLAAEPVWAAPPSAHCKSFPTTQPIGARDVWVPSRTDRCPIPRIFSTLQSFQPRETKTFATTDSKITFSPGLQLRSVVGWVSPFSLDRNGNRYEEPAYATGRLRFNPKFKPVKGLVFTANLDLISGRWGPNGSTDAAIAQILSSTTPGGFGQPPEPGKLTIVVPRELYLEALIPFVGRLTLGQTAFQWGDGIFANSGNNQDRFGDMRFGDDGVGDITERMMLTSQPFGRRGGAAKHLIIGIGGDMIFRDENFQLVKGDLGAQGVALIRYDPGQGSWVGAYSTYRRQRSRNDHDDYGKDRFLELGTADIAGQGIVWLPSRHQLLGSFEGVFSAGHSSEHAFDGDRQQILRGGAVARAYAGAHEKWLLGFDAGFASGDKDPNDDVQTSFTFDSGHRVGLLIFPQILGWRSAQAEFAGLSPTTGVPLPGAQQLPSHGAVSNAAYIQPMGRWAFAQRFELWGGPLIAFAPSPVIDRVATQEDGVPTNFTGGPASKRFYGTEVDLGLRTRLDVENLWFQLGAQGAVLFPGDALQGPSAGNRPGVGVWLRTEVRY